LVAVVDALPDPHERNLQRLATPCSLTDGRHPVMSNQRPTEQGDPDTSGPPQDLEAVFGRKRRVTSV
jgi:hypothetical protein